jgi:hypothetical protein
MRVEIVFLTRQKTVEAREDLAAAEQVGLCHFPLREDCFARG